jgi:hypothetical protein
VSESVIKRPVECEDGMLLDATGSLMSQDMRAEELQEAAACINLMPRAIELLRTEGRTLDAEAKCKRDIEVRALLTDYDTALKGDVRAAMSADANAGEESK